MPATAPRRPLATPSWRSFVETFDHSRSLLGKVLSQHEEGENTMNRRLLLFLIPVLIADCTTFPGGNPCAKSVPLSSSNRPIVCVDDRNLSRITSNPYEAWAKRNSPIKWYTVSGQGGLVISFVNEACVKGTTVVCTGSSCRAQLSSDAVYDTRCEYVVKLTRNDKTTTGD